MNTICKTTILFLACAAAATASADRVSTAVTDERFVGNVSQAALQDVIGDGFRLHDIEITSTSPLRFAGCLVRNTGSYAKAWWWTADRSLAEFQQFIAERGARPLDIEVTVVNNQRRYAGTFIHNIGADAVGWQMFEELTFAQLQQSLGTFHGRAIDLDVRLVNGTSRYSGVMIKNTGSFAKSSVVFGGRTKAQVDLLMAQTSFRLTDLERTSPGIYAGILESNPNALSWYQVGRTWSQLLFDQGQANARVTDIEHYTLNGASRYNYILINNCNALETRVGQMLRNGSNGVVGFYAREVGGARMAQLMADYQFYPASTIKMLEHLYWSYQVDQGLSQATQIPVYTNSTKDTHLNTDPFTLQSLVQTQRNMMLVSSNSNANALQDAAGNTNGVTGRANINAFASSILGLDSDIQLNHKLASGGINNNPYNIATGREYGLMMEKATDGSVFSPSGFNYLRSNMLNESNNSGFRQGLRSIVNQEGALAGLTLAQINNYWAGVRLIWKGGNNGTTNVSSVAHAILPFNSGGRVTLRRYVLSAFVEGATNNTLGADGMSSTILPELLREEVREGVQSW